MHEPDQLPLRVAITGTGRAASARRAALAAVAGCTEVERGDAQAVIVCSENARHFEQAHEALRSGCHVAVEFPLCATAEQARELYGLADRVGRVLHLEVFALLADGICGVGTAQEAVHSDFTGGAYRWLADEIERGHLGQLAVGRLHVLWRLAGPLQVVDVVAERTAGGYRLAATLQGRAQVQLVETRAPAATRGWTLTVDGHTVPPAARSERLFERDTLAFLAAIRGTAPSYVTAQEAIAVARLAEEISLLAATSSPGG